MTSVPSDFIIEAYPDAPVEIEEAGLTAYDMIVEFGNVEAFGLSAQQPEIIEVFSMPPVGGGYNRTEVLAFTKQGPLTVVTSGASEFPIAGGNFLLESFAARVITPPTGSSIVLDILKNNVSVFSVPGNRPTIAASSNTAVTTLPSNIMFADGDYLEVQIVSVGSTTPGVTLTASVRLTRIG